MKAIVYDRYGSTDVLELKEVEKPKPKDDEVLIKVYAASINDWDIGLLQGASLLNRLLSGILKPKVKILGSDIAGKIVALGKNAKQFHLGDEVYGDLSGRWGGFAQYVCARENALILKPLGMTYVEAASIPQAAVLAIQGLIDKGQIQQGQKLLINGAGGGVGTFAIQIAKTYGVKEITGVDSSDKFDMMHEVGFDHVIDYTKEDFTNNGQCYDLILDAMTNRSTFNYLRALSPDGIYVTVGGSMSKLLQAFLIGPIISIFSKKKIRIVALISNKHLAYMNDLFEAGKIKPVIDETYNLEAVPQALKYFEAGHHKGKVVITIENS
ncbi:MAG: NAD(P)-dependent alcohol dehydrogenase [Vallitaleaceae bacterium]|jgi:NADPH:quinone reductase-like Zn-dependent oxidoreductase|nr:NAD(P)-dependent alcohol dehydrogenase [Vallitaleaceae bacterium]